MSTVVSAQDSFVAMVTGLSPNELSAAASSSRIADEATRLLRASSYYYLRGVSCTVKDDELTLRGRVPTFYLKQIVQTIVERIPGVNRIVNLVDVVNPAAPRSS